MHGHLFIELGDHLASCLSVNILDLEDLSITHFDNACRKVLQTLVVCNHDHSNLMLNVQVDEDLHDDVSRLGIKIASGLIEQEN